MMMKLATICNAESKTTTSVPVTRFDMKMRNTQ
jgi:hypothetical protein